MKRLVLVLACCCGCAMPAPGDRNGLGGGGGGGGGGGSDGGAPDDLAQPATMDLASHDLSGGHDLEAAPDLTSPPQLSCVPRINEVMTGTPGQATAEFVELYNPCAASVDVSGWKLVYRAGTNVSTVNGVDSSTLFAFASGTSIPSHQFRVYGGSGFGGTKDGALSASLKDGDGSVGLRDGSGTLVDSVGYGSVDPSNTFKRGSAAPAPPVVASGGSIGRIPDGSESNDNGADFKITTATSPGSANY